MQATSTEGEARPVNPTYAFNNAGAEQQPKPTADITEEE
jgi:hypothetical protein